MGGTGFHFNLIHAQMASKFLNDSLYGFVQIGSQGVPLDSAFALLPFELLKYLIGLMWQLLGDQRGTVA